MAFTTKQWQDNSLTTPWSAQAAIDMETRLSGYTDSAVTAGELGLHVKRDMGAVGNGTTDDRAAFQSGINFLNSVGGGTLYVPNGTFLIGSPGIVWPQNCLVNINLVGQGMGSSATSNGAATRLIRNGAYNIIKTTSTGVSSTTVTNAPNVKDLMLDGKGSASPVVDFQGPANAVWTRVQIISSARQAILGRQLWNVHFTDCHFGGCGDPTANAPAISISDNGDPNGTNTVHFTACEFEGNLYDDIQALSNSVGIGITNCKFERSNGAAVRASGTSAGIFVNGCYFYQDEDTAHGGPPYPLFPAIIVNGGQRVSITGNGFSSGSVTPSPGMIQLASGGYTSVMGNTFLTAGGVHIYAAAGFGEVQIGLNSHHPNGSPTKFSDNRTSKTGTYIANGTIAQGN